jgi:hypothetical protein
VHALDGWHHPPGFARFITPGTVGDGDDLELVALRPVRRRRVVFLFVDANAVAGHNTGRIALPSQASFGSFDALQSFFARCLGLCGVIINEVANRFNDSIDEGLRGRMSTGARAHSLTLSATTIIE